MNIPNLLTLIRILLIPIFVLVFFLPEPLGHWGAAVIFLLAGITDYLDGMLARTLHQTSALGRFLDPVADKLIIAVSLVMMVGNVANPFLTIPAAIIVGREIVVSALREWMAEIGKRANVAVSFIGKLKTLSQMGAIFFLLLYPPTKLMWLGVLGYILLYLAAALTIWSMFVYLKAAWVDLVVQRDTHEGP